MKPRKQSIFICSILAFAWLTYGLAGDEIARLLVASLRKNLSGLGLGLFQNPELFVQNRLREALWLFSLIILWAGLHKAMGIWISKLMKSRWRWTVHAAAGLLLLNVWIAFAMKTALFWFLIGIGERVVPYRQFQLNRLLAAEVQTPFRIVLAGSSQTHAQIDANLLNQRMGSNSWTTDLYFPGCDAYGLMVVEPFLLEARPSLMICYLTEDSIYLPAGLSMVDQFFNLRSLFNGPGRNPFRLRPRKETIRVLLGNSIPLFRCRDALGYRFLGGELMELSQKSVDLSRFADVEGRSKRRARAYSRGARSEFQKQSLEEFISRCGRAGCRVLLLTGSDNPILASKIDPAVRADFLQFLELLAARQPMVTVVPASDLPTQSPADYAPMDLVHANAGMRRRFTLRLLEILRGQEGENLSKGSIAK